MVEFSERLNSMVFSLYSSRDRNRHGRVLNATTRMDFAVSALVLDPHLLLPAEESRRHRIAIVGLAAISRWPSIVIVARRASGTNSAPVYLPV